jgi:hypothetical protein
MNTCVRWAFQFALISSLFILPACANTIARVKLADLFKQADLVAVVKIVSGDGEHYPVVVYKATILAAFKGIVAKETIFFGPFEGFGVGNEYVVFLNKSALEVRPEKHASVSSYGALPVFYRIMYDGFSILPSGYECVFDGKEISEQCDYSVKLNTEQIVLPSGVEQFPLGRAGPLTNYCKWVRKSVFIGLLERLEQSK